MEALVQVVRADSRFDDWKFLLDIIENDPEPRVRHQLLLMLAEHPPFEKGRGSHLDTIPVMERLWKLMKYVEPINDKLICAHFQLFFSTGLPHDAMLRNDVVDLYNSLYGKRKPPCLSGSLYQRVTEVPPTAMETEILPGPMHPVSFRMLKLEVKSEFLMSFFRLGNISD